MTHVEWPVLDHDALAGTVDYLNRIVQVAGKYTLDALFEPGWGNIVYDVAPRGLRTPTLRHGATVLDVYYRLLDGDVVIETDRGSIALPIGAPSVARFHDAFCEAAAELGVSGPASTRLCEIPASPQRFELDDAPRRWDPVAGALVWQGFALAAGGLSAWQAPYRGHRPRVGVMWGAFDLSATRYRAARTAPPADRPSFQQHGMAEEYVAVGFSWGGGGAPVGMYAYIAPEPAGMAEWEWQIDGAAWDRSAGLVAYPWAALRRTPDPTAAIVDFGDAVYDAAATLAGWRRDWVGRRFDGWVASTTPPAELDGAAAPADA